MWYRIVLVVLTMQVVTAEAWAWGGVGHRTVCEIAFQELTDTARKEVIALIRKDRDYETFAEACTWADEEAQKEKRRPDHVINVPRYYVDVRTSECRLGDRCLFSAIRYDGDTLSYSTSTRARLESLKYLGHWVGDIHQPLHVSYADDLGGNRIRQAGVCHYSLHSVWDTCVIHERLGNDYKDIASRLRATVTPQQREEWTDSTLVDWAAESYDLALNQDVRYCEKAGNACRYAAGNERWDEGEAEKTVTVDDAYLDWAAGVVELRLQKAGVRLGALLNRILDAPSYD